MRQKLITLCPNSWDIAQKKPNFSQWVRSQLIEENKNQDFIEEEVEYLRERNEAMSALLDAIRENKKEWIDGKGWSVVHE